MAGSIRNPAENDVYARSGLRVYFKDFQSAEAAWEVIEKFRTDNIDGFTLFGGPGLERGQYLGMRFIFMPEYVHEVADVARMAPGELDALVMRGREEAFRDMATIRDQSKADPRISHALVEHFDVLNGSRETYDQLLEQLQREAGGAGGAEVGVAPDTGGAGPWRRPISRSVAERAERRLGGRAGGDSSGSQLPAAAANDAPSE